jgi:glycine/D-amino acid oxidase-like deaminating enzyme
MGSDRLRLHSGAPYWLLDAGLEEFSAPSAACDVAIVGAGITGALLADRLTGAGLSVTLFDRRAPAYGSTAASTALLQYEIDVELLDLISRVGEADAVRSYQLCAAAITELGALCEELGPECGFVPRSSLYLASRRRDAKRLQQEMEARARVGLDVTWWDRKQVDHRYGIPSHGALRTDSAAEVSPVRLTRALLRRAIGRGAGLFIRTTVEQVEREGSGVRLQTSRGTVRAGTVIYAAGYEVPAPLRAELVALHSSYAMVTEPLGRFGRWDDGCLIWESARPYCYLRSTQDGRILIGGLDVPFRDPDWRDRLLPDKASRLEQRLRNWLPDVMPTRAYAWAGTFGETKDGLPFVGAAADAPQIAYALGYGGNGITFSLVAANILRDQCLGRPNDDARIFRLDR